jgi:hypothetical protein
MSSRRAVVAYLLAIVAANLSVVWFGPRWSIVNAFLFIGLDLTLRDSLHESWRGRGLLPRMTLLIATGSAISFLLNADAGRIGIASFVAFAVAASLDAVVYHRTGSISKSNAAGAAADSVLFPVIAFGGFPVGIIAGQFIAKVAGGEVWKRVIAYRQVADKPSGTSSGEDTGYPVKRGDTRRHMGGGQ